MFRASQNLSKRVTPQSLRVSASYVAARPCTSKAGSGEVHQPIHKPPPPPPPPRSGGGFFWKFLGLSLAGSGGVVAYAWYDKKFRETVEGTLPYSKDAFDYLFQYLPPSNEVVPRAPVPKKTPETLPLAIDAEEAKKLSLQKKKDPVPAVEEKRKEVTKPTATEIAAKKKEEEKKKAEEKKKREKEEAVQKIREKEMEEAAENQALEQILAVNLDNAQDVVKKAIELQKCAASDTRAHTKQLREAMDKQGEDAEGQWEAATKAFSAKSESLANAEVVTEDARQELERVRATINEGKANKVTKKNNYIRSTEQSLNSLNYDLKTAIAENAKAQSEAKVMAEYRDLVRKGKDQFRKEIESLTPEIAISSKGGRLTEEELNALIAHAHRRIEQLQRQLAEAQALEQLRIEAALERQQQEDDRLADARVEREREHMRAEFSVQKDKWDLDARVALEVELRKELARQAAAHSDHMAQVLRVQEAELKAKFDVLLGEKVAEERDTFQREVAGWIGRLKGIEAAVDGRAEMEKIGRKAQELWLACQMLHQIIQPRPGAAGSEQTDEDDEDTPYEGRIQSLLDEFMAVLDAGNNHPFVNSILETIPDEAIKRGVWTESVLVERFDKVRKMCRRTAMIDESGGTMFQYILSYLQSVFVFSTSKPLSDLDKVDPSKLTTFVLLDNAQYCLSQGNLEQALRFMNQLQGEPRRQAADWIREARLLLETRQAADALVAHASANGLGALF